MRRRHRESASLGIYIGELRRSILECTSRWIDSGGPLLWILDPTSHLWVLSGGEVVETKLWSVWSLRRICKSACP
jgi:hypothetical protein